MAKSRPLQGRRHAQHRRKVARKDALVAFRLHPLWDAIQNAEAGTGALLDLLEAAMDAWPLWAVDAALGELERRVTDGWATSKHEAVVGVWAGPVEMAG